MGRSPRALPPDFLPIYWRAECAAAKGGSEGIACRGGFVLGLPSPQYFCDLFLKQAPPERSEEEVKPPTRTFPSHELPRPRLLLIDSDSGAPVCLGCPLGACTGYPPDSLSGAPQVNYTLPTTVSNLGAAARSAEEALFGGLRPGEPLGVPVVSPLDFGL